jgi:hypothetical protein
VLRNHQGTTGDLGKRIQIVCASVQTLQSKAPNIIVVQSSKTLRQIIREQTPGSWVAISLEQKCVVGLGVSPDEAKLIAKAEGEAQVILLRVPEKRTAVNRMEAAHAA